MSSTFNHTAPYKPKVTQCTCLPPPPERLTNWTWHNSPNRSQVSKPRCDAAVGTVGTHSNSCCRKTIWALRTQASRVMCVVPSLATWLREPTVISVTVDIHASELACESLSIPVANEKGGGVGIALVGTHDCCHHIDRTCGQCATSCGAAAALARN